MPLQIHTTEQNSRPGMSLLEVMIAITVLTAGIFATMSHFATLASMRRVTAETNTARSVVCALAERFQGCRWEVIGSDDAPWSLPRPEPATATNDDDETITVTAANAPMMDDGLVPAADRATRGLQTLGLLQGPSGLDNLQIHIEYYRALTAKTEDGENDVTKPGIMDGEPGGIDYASADEFQQRYLFDQRWSALPISRQYPVLENRAKVRLATTSVPTAQVGEYDPIAIRIIATWGGNGQFALFTARKR